MRHRHFKTSNTFPNYASHNYKSARSVYARMCDRRYVYTYVSTRCISCIGAAAAEMATATADDVYVHWIQCCIRGYHVYQQIWYPTIGEILGFARERDNTHDRYIYTLWWCAVQRIGKGASLGELWKKLVIIFPSFAHAMATIDCGFCDTS